MFGFHRLAIVGVVVAGGVTAHSISDRSRQPIARTEPPQKPVVVSQQDAAVREAERGQHTQRPDDSKREWLGRNFDSILKARGNDGSKPKARPAEAMPETFCRSVEPAPKSADRNSGSQSLHDLTVRVFEQESGFGLSRIYIATNEKRIPSRIIARVELVSLLTEYEPSAYVLDEMATPALALQARRRPLDDFERLGLEAVRRGENLVWTREAPTRMFGAIRAKANCVECHTNAKAGDLLGAFSYYLNTPVDEIGVVHNP